MADTLANRSCDSSACPAPAQRQVLVYDQDFYFCGHHATELAGLLATLPTPPSSAPNDREPGGVAPAAAVVGSSPGRSS